MTLFLLLHLKRNYKIKEFDFIFWPGSFGRVSLPNLANFHISPRPTTKKKEKASLRAQIIT